MTGWSTWREICGGAVIVCLIMALAAGTGGRANAEEAAGTGLTEDAADLSSTGKPSAEYAEEIEPEPDPDVTAPAVTIEMAQEVRKDEDGNIYCRADNAGIRVILEDDREADTGIASYSIVMADPEDREFRKEEAVSGKTVTVEIGPERAASLSDGEIRVTAEALDASGNRRTEQFFFIKDTVNPVLSANVDLPLANPSGIDEVSGIVYYGSAPEQYEGGEPAITALFRVTDQNIDPEDLELRTAYAAVPEGQCCGQADPSWENAVREEGQVTVTEGADGTSREILLELRRSPGQENTPDGVYRFGIAGTDKAGNPLVTESAEEAGQTDAGSGEKGSEDMLTGLDCRDAEKGIFMTGRKAVDTAAPGGELCFENESGEVYGRYTAHDRNWILERESFMPYRSEGNGVIAYRAFDPSPVSISCRVLSTAGENNDTSPDAGNYEYGCSGSLQIRGGQVFRAEDLILRDRAGNESAQLLRTEDFYLDTGLPEADLEAPAAVVKAVSEITYLTPDERGLYSGPVTLEIFAKDPDRMHGGSGLGEVRCIVNIDGETAREEVLFISGEEPGQGPVYQYYGEITIPASGRWESNDIEVTVTATDNAGNSSDPEKGGICRFGTDTTGPEVTVSYDNNDVRNGRYFDKERIAAITVRERNFDRGKLTVKAPGAVLGEWQRGPASDPELWTLQVQFHLDGAYTPQVSGTDALGNPASVVYTGEAPQEFIIDRTPPLIEVLWDNSDVRNGKYYNRQRCALIRITDLSFDMSTVKILPFSRPFSKVSEVRDDRTAGMIPVYEAEIPFSREGEWDLKCLCMDLAGNWAVPVLEDSFIIDRTAPRLYFDPDTVLEMGAYGGEVSPVLRCEEENPVPGSLCARWSNRTAGGCTMECRGGAGEEKGSAVLPDLPQERPADGICVLSGTACDLAGNRTMIRRNLCVNRFGSLYDVSEDEKTLEMINDLYTEAEDPFVIAEYNVSPVTDRQITLYRNGDARILEEGKDYTVTEEKSSAGVKYIYTIDPSAYSREGKYSLLVESVDETGNYSSSPGRFTAGAEYSASWAVDRTPPAVRIAGVDTERKRFVTDVLPVRLVPSDNMELTDLEIEVTDDQGGVLERRRFEGEELREILERNRGEIPFEIRACGKWQTLRAEARDGAGNCSSGILGIGTESVKENGTESGTEAAADREEPGYRVLVSANLMVHIYRSGALPAAAFLALISAFHYGYTVYKHTLA